jgi:hypothetical protein
MEFHDQHGFFTFRPEPPTPGSKGRWAKAFIHPSEGLIAAFTGQDVLMIRFAHHSPRAIHPTQALVELYNAVGTDPSAALMELEYHAPYRTLQPGESMSAEQTWEVQAYNGGCTAEEHTAFLMG